MSDANQSTNDRKNLFRVKQARLITAIYSSTSAYNGDLIYSLLDELRELKEASLADELSRCETLVQRWKDTWYPDPF